jgi:hypothetical protein
VEAFVLENAQKMKVFDLLEVVELEIGQNHNIIITVQDSFLFGLSVQYVPDPVQVTELILEECLFFPLVLFGSFLFDVLDGLLVFFFVFFSDGKNRLNFKTVLEHHFVL